MLRLLPGQEWKMLILVGKIVLIRGGIMLIFLEAWMDGKQVISITGSAWRIVLERQLILKRRLSELINIYGLSIQLKLLMFLLRLLKQVGPKPLIHFYR